MSEKVYVAVTVRFDVDGNMTPIAIEWEDGHRFEIEKVLDSRRAASTKVGGVGMRFCCRVLGRETYLFYENPCWFVEGRG